MYASLNPRKPIGQRETFQGTVPFIRTSGHTIDNCKNLKWKIQNLLQREYRKELQDNIQFETINEMLDIHAKE